MPATRPPALLISADARALDQLWETTLDPGARSLLQVKVEHASDADDLFSRLMSEEVEPCRELNLGNVLSVANSDFKQTQQNCLDTLCRSAI